MNTFADCQWARYNAATTVICQAALVNALPHLDGVVADAANTQLDALVLAAKVFRNNMGGDQRLRNFLNLPNLMADPNTFAAHYTVHADLVADLQAAHRQLCLMRACLSM